MPRKSLDCLLRREVSPLKTGLLSQSTYIQVLTQFKAATLELEGRGKAGTSGAIWEVIPTFDWLVNQLQNTIERLDDAKFDDPDAPEDHLLINCRAALKKLLVYYNKLQATLVYYAACRLHPEYKNYLENAWRVPDEQLCNSNEQTDWLEKSHYNF